VSAEYRFTPQIESDPMQATIRPVCVEDLDALSPIILHWVRLSKDTTETPEAKTQRYLQDMEASTHEGSSSYYAVAQTPHGEVIGIGGIKSPSQSLLSHTQTSNPAEIVNMYVHPQHRRGKHIGTHIIDELEKVAKANEHTELILISGPTFQDTGWGFYRRLEETRHFEYVAMAQDYYGEGINAPVWRKPLETT
jgi:ribosomal protein S18 acetylase RimI-like enzyme